MKNVVAKIAAGVLALTLLAGIAAGAPGQGVKCPVCKMPLSSKRTKSNPVAVRLKKGGKIMYCCAGCKMPASVLVKTGKKGKGHRK